jgi:diguanylate cyclase (GGDEF)-like protein/PAS domain S-box-containing protein
MHSLFAAFDGRERLEKQILQAKSKDELVEEVTRLYKYLSTLETVQAEYIQSIETLREDIEKYRLLLDEASDPIFMFYRDGRYRYVNKAFAEGVGMDVEEIIEHTIWDVFPRDEAEKRYAVVKWVFENAETRVIEVRVPRSYGDHYYLTTVKPILDEQSQVEYAICISKEITDRKRVEQELQYLSNHDILTRLYNRNFFDAEISRLQLSRLFPIGIVIVDMNNLKATNDRFGHAAGDDLIRQVAAALRNSFRAGDVIARIGGDEFAIILVQTNEEGMQSAVERLRANIRNHKNDLLSIAVGMSLGKKGSYLPEIIRQADDRMYQDKLKYRGRMTEKTVEIAEKDDG